MASDETIDVGPVFCRHGINFTEPCGRCFRGSRAAVPPVGSYCPHGFSWTSDCDQCHPAPPVGSEGPPPVPAAEFLHERLCYWMTTNGHVYGMDEARFLIEDLLSHGSEYGVAILADGSLRPLTEGEKL